MYYVIVICAAIVCLIGFVLYLLKKHEKLGKYENEVKSWEDLNKILEIIRKEKANVSVATNDAIDDIVRKNARP